jgi:hypothetical protein
MDLKGLDELRNRAAMLDDFIAENRELKEEVSRLKKAYQNEKEGNIYRRENEQKSRDEKDAFLDYREKVHDIPKDKKVGFFEHMASKGIIPNNAPAVIAERNRKRQGL